MGIWLNGKKNFTSYTTRAARENNSFTVSDRIITEALCSIEDEAYSLFGCLENTVEIHEDIVEGTGEVWEVDV